MGTTVKSEVDVDVEARAVLKTVTGIIGWVLVGVEEVEEVVELVEGGRVEVTLTIMTEGEMIEVEELEELEVIADKLAEVEVEVIRAVLIDVLILVRIKVGVAFFFQFRIKKQQKKVQNNNEN